MRKCFFNKPSLWGISILLITILVSVPALSKRSNLLVDDREFRDPDEVWDFIPDYSDITEGEDVDWVWTKPGVHLSQFETVDIPIFENISKTIDVVAQDLLTRNMKEGVKRLGLEVVEDTQGEITIYGGMVDYFSGSGAAEFLIGFGAGEPFVEVEIYVVDNATGEIISKVRHQAHAWDIDSAIAETISDIINYWAQR